MRLADLLLGRPLASHEEGHQRVGPFAGLPMLGLDGLASAAYGPEAALTILIPLGAAGLAYSAPIIGVIVAILFVLYFSYRQTIAVYPGGGGSYTVARENLGAVPGLTAAAALLLDYVLVLAAKFVEGAWITALLIPSFVALFLGVKRHYAAVHERTRLRHALDLTDLRPLRVIVPVKDLDIISAKAILLAMSVSPNVVALHVATGEADLHHMNAVWKERVVAPLLAAGRAAPELHVLQSPYRRLLNPLIDHIAAILEANPGCNVAVVIPELVEAHPWQYLLHNQRATGLKAALLLRGGHRVVVMNVPWYLGEE